MPLHLGLFRKHQEKAHYILSGRLLAYLQHKIVKDEDDDIGDAIFYFYN